MKGITYKNDKEQFWLHVIRKIELGSAIKFFPQNNTIRILEIGAGDGYLAKCISDKGYNITAIDINPRYPQSFEVKEGDVRKLDFHSESFDLVFSSLVLQNIEDYETAFKEIKRILKENGLVIHIVPTSWWTILTNFWHFVLLPRDCWKYLKKSDIDFRKNQTQTRENNNRRNHLSKKLLKYIFCNPVGIHASFLHEIYYFSNYSWRKLFLKHGFKIDIIEKCPFVYSGHSVFLLSYLKIRKILGKYFPSSMCYVLRKHDVIDEKNESILQ